MTLPQWWWASRTGGVAIGCAGYANLGSRGSGVGRSGRAHSGRVSSARARRGGGRTGWGCGGAARPPPGGSCACGPGAPRARRGSRAGPAARRRRNAGRGRTRRGAGASRARGRSRSGGRRCRGRGSPRRSSIRRVPAASGTPPSSVSRATTRKWPRNGDSRRTASSMSAGIAPGSARRASWRSGRSASSRAALADEAAGRVAAGRHELHEHRRGLEVGELAVTRARPSVATTVSAVDEPGLDDALDQVRGEVGHVAAAREQLLGRRETAQQLDAAVGPELEAIGVGGGEPEHPGHDADR